MHGYMNFPFDHDMLVKAELAEHGYAESPDDDGLKRRLFLFEIRERLVPARQYYVHLSREIRANPQFAALQQTVEEVIGRMRSRQSLAPYLSTLASRLTTHDYLLANWGIHHLHLNPLSTLDEGGYVTRTDHLLFFRVDGANVHLIDIGPHDFVQEELVRIVDRNWPDLHQHMRGLMPHVQSAAQIKMQRKGSLTVPVQTDTRAVMPTFGVATSGRSLAGVMEADRVTSELRQLEALVAENYDRWFPRSLTWITSVQLVSFKKDGYDVFDGASGHVLQLERTG